MSKKILLIGGSGFVGTHLRATLGPGHEIISHGREFDVRKVERLRELISAGVPDQVVFLAAITTLGESVSKPAETYDIGFSGLLNVLMVLQEYRFSGRMLFVSSSEVYGLLTEQDLPVSEGRLPMPLSPYAVAKIAGEALCHQWSEAKNFEIVSARPFNHIGPGQSERFAIADFGRQIAAIKLHLSEPVIYVGDIDTTRDFTDVRDVARAYEALLDRGRNGEIYNVCSGRETSIRSLIDRMCALAGVEVELRADPNRLRRSDQRRVYGNNFKLLNDTGWKPKLSLDQTLSDILAYWELRLDQGVIS